MTLDAASILSLDSGNLRPSPIRAFAKLLNDPSVISFAGGVPSPETFPAELIAEHAGRVIRESRNVSLQYGPTRGLPSLRQFIGAWRTDSADDTIVTTGSQQALDLLATVLLDPGDVVLVELPTYVGGTASFHKRRAELVGVEQDDDGLVVEALDETITRLVADGRKVKAIYTIPTFQNPSGRLLPDARRDALVDVARRHGVVVIEDDPYGELSYDDASPVRSIRSRDRDHVVYLGSFSKILAPGLRCGYLIAPAPLAAKIEVAKEAADLCSGMLDQSIVASFCEAGELPGQILRIRNFYRQRRDTLIGSLQSELGSRATWTDAKGGLFTFVTLDDSIDTAARLEQCVAEGVAYIPGSPFFVDGGGRSTMRLTFAKEPDDRMREGVRRLASILV